MLLTHKVTLQFNRHEIPAGDLSRPAGKGMLVPRGAPVRLAVPARHLLSADKEKELCWRALDTVTFTTPTLWVDHASRPSFAPRYLKGVYRDGRLSGAGQKNGILKLRHAASGLHDDYLVSSIEKAGTDAVILTGGAVTHFSSGGGAKAFVATVSWIDSTARAALGLSEDALLQSRGGRWKVAIADLWARQPLEQAGALKSVPLKMTAQEEDISALLGRAGLPQAGGKDGLVPLLPVEQAFFEKVDDKGNALAMAADGSDLTAAPFFIRAMLALDALWQEESAAAAGKLPAGTLVAALPHTGPVVRLVPGAEQSREGEPAQPGGGPEAAATLFPADLVVLSREAGSKVANYRMISGVDADAGFDFESAEIRDRALLEDRRAGAAIRIARMEGDEVRLHHVAVETRGLDFLSVPASPLIRHGTDLGVSAALGWPMREGLEEAGRLSAALGDAFPVQSDESGFAARFQLYGWPAFATGGSEGYHVSFASHVVYDRTGTPAFDGPPARHLLVSPVRRRVPIPARDGKEARAAILPPAITRATIGRRPGVFEVSTAAITVPGVARDFDPGRPHLGRPAISAPVTAAQVRNPRAPALPADGIAASVPLDEQVLAPRRRTYLSLADLVADGKRRQLAPFGEFAGDADVFRLQEDEQAPQWRIIVRMAGDTDFGPDWNGELVLEIEGRSSAWVGSFPERMGAQLGSLLFGTGKMPSARLEIAGLVFDRLNVALPDFDFWSPRQYARITAGSGAELRDIRDALAQADADTAMRLVMDFNLSAQDGYLPVRRWNGATASIPLRLSPGERRVMAVAARTVAFGDPSYDRQLASLAMQGFDRIGNEQYVLAADRREYGAGSTLFIAAGKLGGDGGFSHEDQPSFFTLRLRRLPAPDGAGEAGPPVEMVVDTFAHDNGGYRIGCGAAHEVPLSRLVAREAGLHRTPALLPGEQLEISGTFDGHEDAVFRVRVRIATADAIAPAPSVFTVMEEARGGKSAAVLLHAAGPLPQRIEFTDLAGDLARGHVRRKALFVWRHARPGSLSDGGRLQLVKMDRSGGAQLPEPALQNGLSEGGEPWRTGR